MVWPDRLPEGPSWLHRPQGSGACGVRPAVSARPAGEKQDAGVPSFSLRFSYSEDRRVFQNFEPDFCFRSGLEEALSGSEWGVGTTVVRGPPHAPCEDPGVQNPGCWYQQADEGQTCLCFSARKMSLGRSLAISQLPLEWGRGGDHPTSERCEEA